MQSRSQTSVSVSIIYKCEEMIKNGQEASAVEILETVKNYFYDSYRYNLALGQAYMNLDNKEKRNFYFSRCIMLAPMNEVAFQIYSNFNSNENERDSEKKFNKDAFPVPNFFDDFPNPKQESSTTSTSVPPTVITTKSSIDQLSELLQTLGTEKSPVPLPQLYEVEKDSQIFSFNDDIEKTIRELLKAKIPRPVESNEILSSVESDKYKTNDNVIPIPTRQLAKIYTSQGAYQKAIQVYQLLTNLEPNHTDEFRSIIHELQKKAQ